MSNTKSYNRRYYLRNKKKLLEERRLRYRTDKGYRRGIHRRCKARTVLEKASRLVDIPTVRHANRTERAYSLKEMCQAVDRHHSVLYRWKWNGIMPEPIYHPTKNKGVFSESQVQLMQFVCGIADEGGELTYDEMSEVLAPLWRKRFNEKAVIKQLEAVQNGNKEGRKTNSKKSGRVRGKGRKDHAESKAS